MGHSAWLDFLEGLERLVAAVELLRPTRDPDYLDDLHHALLHTTDVEGDVLLLGARVCRDEDAKSVTRHERRPGQVEQDLLLATLDEFFEIAL